MIERIYWYFLHRLHIKHWRYLDFCPSWKCNAKCPTCGAWKRPTNSLTKEQADLIIKDKAFKHIKYMVIEGGEPTLWEHLILFVVGFLEAHPKAKIGMITNGLLVEKISGIAYTLEQYADRLHWVLSLNGIGEMHDRSRGVPGAFGKTIASAEILKKIYRVSFSYTPFVENFEHYEKVVELGKQMGIFVGVCYPTHAAKFGESGMTWTMLPKDKLNHILTESAKRYKWAWDKWAWLYFCEKAQAKELMPCYAGEQLIHITPEGTIRPCSFYESWQIGNVGETVYEADNAYVSEITRQIPDVCQYRTGGICDHCLVGLSLNCEFPRVIKWGLGAKRG